MNKINLFAIAVIVLFIVGLALVGMQGNATPQADHDHSTHSHNTTHYAHLGTVGEYSGEDGFDPDSYLSAWNFNDLPENQRSQFYKETTLPNGTLLREYWIYAEDKQVEVAPGVFFEAWVYNGQTPAPTIRATEGDLIRIHFTNHGTKPHTMHFHGYHAAAMDGSSPDQFVKPGDSFTYEFTAEPAGLHLYHCHSTPLKNHIARGLYGMFIVDPKEGRAPAHELVMMMNAFDTDFDGENDIYAVNTRAFYYMQHPIRVKKGELVRIYVANMVENDPLNSIHTHGNFFEVYSTGTRNTSDAFTDIIELGQGERSVLEMRFPYTGIYMFHAHQTEFSELGWMGAFEVYE